MREEEQRRHQEYMDKVDADIATSQKNYLDKNLGYETPQASSHRESTGYRSGPQGRGHVGGRGNYTPQNTNGGRGGTHAPSSRGHITPEHGTQSQSGQSDELPWKRHGDAEKESQLAHKIGQIQRGPPGAPGGVI